MEEMVDYLVEEVEGIKEVEVIMAVVEADISVMEVILVEVVEDMVMEEQIQLEVLELEEVEDLMVVQVFV